MPTIALQPDGSFSPETIKVIEQELYKSLEEASNEEFPAEHRNHLGVSVIGNSCSRKLWYIFRWVKLEQHDPRMRRLFNRGHREEPNFVKWLFKMGFFVREIDPATNKQYRMSGVNGHYGGSGDSVLLLPWLRGDNDPRILGEFKTHNKKSFEDLKKNKVKLSKPQHWAQMCGYGKAFNIRYGLYCAINKDDDDIYFEFLELDWNYAHQLEMKAQDIITSQIPPPRLSEQPSYFDCKYCHFQGICHYNEPVEINCRSCKQAQPVDNGEWKCSRFDSIIPKDFIKKGCDQHSSINQ